MKIDLVQTTLRPYRVPVFDALVSNAEHDVRVLAGVMTYDKNRPPQEEVTSYRTPVDNRFLLNDKFLWQKGVVGSTFASDAVIIEMNPRCISTWLTFAVRKLFRKQTVAWGHAWPREGQTARSDRVRHLMRRMANSVVVYTETQASELKAKSPKLSVSAAPNALYASHGRATPLPLPEERRWFVYSGRFGSQKKVLRLLEAFSIAASDLPSDVLLKVVGFGPESEDLMKSAAHLGIADRVDFVGQLFEYDALDELYGQAIASTSPGFVGLSIIQSHWFGVPMIVSRNEPHAPEIEAAVDGENTFFVESSSAADFASSLVWAYKNREALAERAVAISTKTRRLYSVEAMASALLHAAEGK